MTLEKLLLASSVPLGLALLASLAYGPSGLTPAAEARGCNPSDLDGEYAYVVHGVNPDQEPFGSIGTFSADGAGHLDGSRVSVDDGVRGTSEFTCTVSVTAGCTFSGPCVDDGEATAEVFVDGAMADRGRTLMLLLSGIPSAADGAVVTGEARRR